MNTHSARQQAIRTAVFWAIVTAAAVGVLTCAILVSVNESTLGSICSNTSSCARVLASRFASFGGIRTAFYGLTYYLGLLTTLAVSAVAPPATFRWIRIIIRVASFAAALISIWLVAVQIWILHSFCWLCFMSAAIALLLALMICVDALTFVRIELGGVITVLIITLLCSVAIFALERRPETVLAKVDGHTITQGDLESELRLTLLPLRQATYELENQWLNKKIMAFVLHNEKAGKGRSNSRAPANQENATAATTWKSQLPPEIAARHNVEIYLRKPVAPIVDFDLTTAKLLGRPNAKVTFVIFSDFECPFCAMFEQTLKRIHDRFPDQVLIAFKYFPLTGHSHARSAAAAAECAAAQGKFWEFHDWLFSHGTSLDDTSLFRAAAELRLDRTSFDQCFRADRPRQIVDANYNEAVSNGLDGAPSIFLNGEMIGGVLSYDELVERVTTSLRK